MDSGLVLFSVVSCPKKGLGPGTKLKDMGRVPFTLTGVDSYLIRRNTILKGLPDPRKFV